MWWLQHWISWWKESQLKPILWFLLLRAHSAALQRAPRHQCVSILWNAAQIQLLLGISKIIKGRIQQRKYGRKKNVTEAIQVSCKCICPSLWNSAAFSMLHTASHLQSSFIPWPKFIHSVKNLLCFSTLPEFYFPIHKTPTQTTKPTHKTVSISKKNSCSF